MKLCALGIDELGERHQRVVAWRDLGDRRLA
jgi:hypothetical protein